MTTEKARTLNDFLKQGADQLTPANLKLAVTDLATACGMFD
jgi:hypothetical protein